MRDKVSFVVSEIGASKYVERGSISRRVRACQSVFSFTSIFYCFTPLNDCPSSIDWFWNQQTKICGTINTLQAALDKEMEQHCRDQRVALASRLRKRKAAKEEALRRAGAGEEEITAAMQALDFDGER